MEAHWLKRAVSALHHKAGKEGLVGTWRVARSTRLQNLAVRIVLLSTALFNGYKFVGILYRMCMEFTHKLASSLVVDS
eukprot:1160337-Pelagomonas_calceolata.AAC.1